MKVLFEVHPSINDPGRVKFAWQKSVANFIAVASTNKIVNIYDRHGKLRSDVLIALPGYCTCLEWDKDGDVLAVTQDDSGVLFFWTAHSSAATKLDSGMKEYLTVCVWSKCSHLLAVGTAKGNLLLYNHRIRRKIPILGKHTKAITTGAWSSENLLALGSEDKTMTINNADGDTLKTITLRADPYDLQFFCVKADESSYDETAVSVVIGCKTLFIYNMDDAVKPTELAFQPHYGEIVSYKCYGSGNIMIGFSNGFFVIISTHKDEIGQELFSSRNHKNHLDDVIVSLPLRQAASCGDNSIKIHDLSDVKEVYSIIEIEEDRGRLDKLQWTDDGRLLTISTHNGCLLTFLAKLPLLGDASCTRLAYLVSLMQVAIVNNVEEEPTVLRDIAMEPTFIALGPFHMAVGANDRAWIYSLQEQGEVFEKSYLGSVTSMQLNGYYVAAIYDGSIHLHMIDSSLGEIKDSLSTNIEEMDQQEREIIFGGEEKEGNILCMALTPDFLIYATEAGSLQYFYLEDWQFVIEYRHIVPIVGVYSDPTGTRLVYVNEKSDAFIYNPVIDSTLQIPNWSPNMKDVLWENWPLNKQVFIAYDEDNIYTYVYHNDTVRGSSCVMVGLTKLMFGLRPLMLYNGEVSCQTLTGKINIMRLTTHNFQDDQDLSEDELKGSLNRSIMLGRFNDAWSYAHALDNPQCWTKLAEAAVFYLEIELAIRAYKHLKNVAMIFSLQQVQHIENRKLLVGYLAMYMEEFNEAQDLFLASSNPMAALEMRQDLLHWDQALNLAKSLAPDQVPYISKEYAQQLEFIGDYANALIYYDKGVSTISQDSKHNEACKCGVARMAIKTGDIRRGITLVQSLSDRQGMKECASILESMKMYAEAALLYDRAHYWDKAAGIYIKSKNWNKVSELISKVSSTRLHAQFAKAREADGHYHEAARAYEAAKDFDSSVRVYLDILKSPDDAVRVVKDSGSMEGAKMVAKFFQKIGDYSSALQFLVLSKCNDAAFDMAEKYKKMEQYAFVIGNAASRDEYFKIATYFQKVADHLQAGQFFFRAGEYNKALDNFMQCSLTKYPDSDPIDLAIKTAAAARNESVIQKLTDYLIGDIDQVPKDAKYLFRMYMALEQFTEASRTAILIAREDQEAGNYRNAHNILFYMYTELRDHDIKVPAEMIQSLMILHSYLLVKLQVKCGNHMKGARLLIRVANNISKFPNHIVPLLTSTVIECHRAGLKASAFSYAAMLMRPEYRDQIDLKWKKKIEQIVRKRDKIEVEEETAPCAYCSHPLPLSHLDCPQCKSTLPYCIVTGQHMVKEDRTYCPNCKFPALLSEFKNLLEKNKESTCPMCSAQVNPNDLTFGEPGC